MSCLSAEQRLLTFSTGGRDGAYGVAGITPSSRHFLSPWFCHHVFYCRRHHAKHGINNWLRNGFSASQFLALVTRILSYLQPRPTRISFKAFYRSLMGILLLHIPHFIEAPGFHYVRFSDRRGRAFFVIVACFLLDLTSRPLGGLS